MMFNNYHVDKSKNKVYINPNFSGPTIHSNPMHVNPKFSHLLPSVKTNLSNQTRIHINPNFMKSGSTDEIIKVNRISTNIKTDSNYLQVHEQLSNNKHVLGAPVAKSRYCLVRQNANKILKEPIPILDKPKTTIQINKYKSVPLSDIKTKLENFKNALNKQTSIVTSQSSRQDYLESRNRKHSSPSISNTKRNQFKLVNKGSVVRNVKIKSQHTMGSFVGVNKKVQSSQSKLNKIRPNLKKNNVPCPMFRKFGRCLRTEHGHCEYLHDKKHVSICRKFIKGLCHDKACLLSHELTMKKMPTCYFYLQGTCTKQDCPYLHVKLNETVKICPDFVKGYCEKGSRCLQRHIHIAKKIKNTSATKSSTFQRKNSKLKAIKIDTDDSRAAIKSDESKVLKNKNENNLDRYYQDYKSNLINTDICELIKPLRCKLGSLPSFIQL